LLAPGLFFTPEVAVTALGVILGASSALRGESATRGELDGKQQYSQTSYSLLAYPSDLEHSYLDKIEIV